jgi:AcrR family transcriptional regulator
MGRNAARREESREKILASAGRGFRSQGYHGLGVDGLAKAAGLTSGAFYAHFKSKAEAFHAAVACGLAELTAGVQALRAGGAGWRRRFVDFYLGDRRTVALAESCALQSLTGDVARADDKARETFEAGLQEVVEAMAPGLEGGREEALALLALLVGGVSLARAVQDPGFSAEIAEAVAKAADCI